MNTTSKGAAHTSNLEGKVAVVTGSTRGIGAAITEALAAAGAAVLAHGTQASEVTARVDEWSARGWKAAGSTANLEDPGAVGELRRCVESQLGRPDILVLNASVEIIQSWNEVTREAMQRQSSINVHASIELIQAFLPAMIERRWGRILAVGSVQEERPNASHLFYAATKLAQTGIVLNLARHEGHPGVTFNVIRPGAILTDRNRTKLADPSVEASLLHRIPAGRIGMPQDCAAAALLLCSDAGSYINGAVLAIDGGLRL
jgi:NAD(P)-dependent dehydrogenase (short-subunit alcohol dehydrogenase family)